MNAPTDLQALKDRPANVPDLKIDMFSLRGFELAQRIGRAFATSDAVPTAFRSHVLKKSNGNETWVENPSALGNCIVAIETAQAVGMSITAVMQNANVIEGRLSWSGKFIIAAVNASRRFTPLRFDLQNKGRIKATYKEKGAWNKELKRYDMTEHQVELENLECIAWALPSGVIVPNNIRTLAQAKEANLPVIESAPVSMKMAVEEGWYAKPGSKWQTEMKFLMLQYRAGAYFGNIHAPDIVMGMGRTTEEHLDVIDVHQQADGSYAVDLEELRAAKAAEQQAQAAEDAPAANAEPKAESTEDKQPQDEQPAAAVTFAQVADQISKSKTEDQVDEALDLVRQVADDGQRTELVTMGEKKKEQLAKSKAAKSRQTSMNID